VGSVNHFPGSTKGSKTVSSTVPRLPSTVYCSLFTGNSATRPDSLSVDCQLPTAYTVTRLLVTGYWVTDYCSLFTGY